jgi:endoglucanase
MVMEASAKHEIPVQVSSAPGGTGTDANAMQISRDGIATGLVGVPLRYMHTPVELLSLTDVENTARLMAGYCQLVRRDTDFIPRLNP